MKNYFEYKNYIGKIEISVEDEVFFGKIYGIDDLVTFEGKSFDELKQAFREAVDDYLELCEECGKEPQKAYKGQFSVRIPVELHKEIAIQAIKEDITLNQLAVKAFKQYMKDVQKDKMSILEVMFRGIKKEKDGWVSSGPAPRLESLPGGLSGKPHSFRYGEHQGKAMSY